METIEGNKITDETLSGVSLSSQPSDELHKILKPSSEIDVKGGAAAGGGGAVVVTSVVEKTEVTVVRVIQEDKDDIFKNQGEGDEGIENDKEGVFGNLVYGDEGMKVNHSENGRSMAVDVKSSLASENGGEVKSVSEGDEIYENAIADESMEDASKNDEEQDEIEEDHDFKIGDFVWGKIKSHPWWPGQIYDPSNASDYAATLKRKGRLLVAYFGDGSFSWSSPSQLKPFVECFQEMSNQTDSKKFTNAVQKVLEEVGRLVEVELMCKCQIMEPVRNVGPVNKGIKEGVLAPKGDTIRVLIDRMQPVEIISILKDSATMKPGSRNLDLDLELVVLKNFLSCFYRQKGGFFLPKYHDPVCVEGLEDEERNVNGPSESADNGDEEMRSPRQRKKKSVAELLGEDEPKSKKSSGMKRERKVKDLVVSVTPESDHESGGIEEEMTSPRQRKKSKYLSPPYLSPIWTGSGSGSFKEPKSEPEKVPEVGAKSRQKRRVREESDSQDSKDESVNVNKVLNGLLWAALDPSGYAGKKNLPEITEFILSFRSSVFEDGSDRKKDSSGMTLVIEFPPEAALPTKTDLSRTYRKVGDLIKKGIQNNKSRAFVVFGKRADAETALAMSMEEKPFGEVKYGLSEEAFSSVKRGSGKKADADDVALDDVAFIVGKLEMMREMVRKCEMSEEVKVSLEEGMKQVIEKVGKMREK